MPMYEYKCVSCNHADTEFRKMASIDPDSPAEVCPACGRRKYERQVSLPHTDMKEFHRPIEMYSIALNTDEEIAAFKQRAPDVHVETDPRHPDYGIPVAASRKQKLSALKAVDFTERK